MGQGTGETSVPDADLHVDCHTMKYTELSSMFPTPRKGDGEDKLSHHSGGYCLIYCTSATRSVPTDALALCTEQLLHPVKVPAVPRCLLSTGETLVQGMSVANEVL